jgi:hypothetical protein
MAQVGPEAGGRARRHNVDRGADGVGVTVAVEQGEEGLMCSMEEGVVRARPCGIPLGGKGRRCSASTSSADRGTPT